MMEKILVVDDDRSICEIIEFNLKNEDFDVFSGTCKGKSHLTKQIYTVLCFP